MFCFKKKKHTLYLTEILEDSKIWPGIALVEYQSIYTKAEMFYPE